MPIFSKDIILFLERDREDDPEDQEDRIEIEKQNLDLRDLYNRHPQDETWFYDIPIHTTASRQQSSSKRDLSRSSMSGYLVPAARGRRHYKNRKEAIDYGRKKLE